MHELRQLFVQVREFSYGFDFVHVVHVFQGTQNSVGNIRGGDLRGILRSLVCLGCFSYSLFAGESRRGGFGVCRETGRVIYYWVVEVSFAAGGGVPGYCCGRSVV